VYTASPTIPREKKERNDPIESTIKAGLPESIVLTPSELCAEHAKIPAISPGSGLDTRWYYLNIWLAKVFIFIIIIIIV
jgi:hypothetical protein